MIQHDPKDLGTQLYRAIARNRSGHAMSPNTEPTSFSDALKWFVRQAGGNVSAAARLAGVPRRSMRDWLAGKSTPPAARRGEVARSAQLSARRSRVGDRREARLRADQACAGATLTGRYNYDPGDDERAPISIGTYLADDAGDRLVDAFLDGGSPEDLRQTFADALTGDATGFYARTMALPPDDTHGWTVSNVNLI